MIGADGAAARCRARRQAVPDAQSRRIGRARWRSARTGRCPRAPRWRASPSRRPGRPQRVIPRAAGRRRRSSASSRRCPHTPRASRDQAFAGRAMGRNRPRRERRPGVAGQGPAHDARRSNCRPSACARPILLGGRSIRLKDERACHVDNAVGIRCCDPAATTGRRPPEPRLGVPVARAVRHGLHGAADRVHHLRHRHPADRRPAVRSPTW